ncbi:MAG: SUF system NifU family Fe-S cluster assembly protein, partial [Chloroflexi bacterium]|nr:SUF system NifU family Fe-S cluster assembly protein [Chloroflexota bacterium]
MASFEQLDDLYKEIILDHYRNPRNRRSIESPDAAWEGANPLCGDEVAIQLSINGDSIEDIAFQGQGCAISQASSSMLTDSLKGKRIDEAKALAIAFKEMMQGKDAVDFDEYGDLEALTGVMQFPVRVKCATLAWNVLEQTLKEYEA